MVLESTVREGKMPKPGFKSITISETVYEKFYEVYEKNKDKSKRKSRQNKKTNVPHRNQTN